MRKIDLIDAIIALSSQTKLTQKEIAKLLKESTLPFDFEEKFNILIKNIDDLDLSIRAFQALKSNGFLYVWQIVSKSKNDFLQFRNFSTKTLSEVEKVVMEFGLEFDLKFTKQELASLYRTNRISI